MGYDDYRNRVDLYWRHRNTDYDRITDARISSLRREIERDNIGNRGSTDSFEVEDNKDEIQFKTPSVERMMADMRRETNQMTAYIFNSYREDLARDLASNEELPTTTRIHIPPLIRELDIANTETPQILQAHMDSIDAAIKLALHLKGLLEYRLALVDIKDALLKLWEVAADYHHETR